MTDDVEFEDPLGFTRQTALLLKGLGRSSLVETIKKRNISTEELSQLSAEDLRTLGAKEEDVIPLLKELRQLGRKKLSSQWSSEYKLKHFVNILKEGENRLSFIVTYLAFVRVNMKKRNKEIDNDFRESSALLLALKSVFRELKCIKEDILNLRNDLVEPEKPSKRKYVIVVGILVSALGLTGSIILRSIKR